MNLEITAILNEYEGKKEYKNECDGEEDIK